MWLIGSNIQLSVVSCQLSAKAENRKPNTGRAFTFVELMITVVILAVGLVLIIQGFITAASALNTTQNHSLAMQFLESKMQEIESAARINKGIKRQGAEGEFSSGGRIFTWNLQAISVEKSEGLDLGEDLNEVGLKVTWQERNQPKDLSLVTYLRNKKE